MKRFIVTFLLIIVGFLSPFQVFAATGNNSIDSLSEQIIDYSTDIVVHKDGSVGFTERIVYNFPEARHGIYRYIPYVKTNDEGKRLKLSIENIRVTDEKNTAYMYITSYENDDVVLQIGDPDQTITGTHSYVISYNVKGALTYFPAHDELYWNAVGLQWKIPTLSAKMTVALPQEVGEKDIQSSCFVGIVGSTEKACIASTKGANVTFVTTRPLEPFEGMTIVVGFPKGIVAEVNPTEIIPFFDTKEGNIILIGLLIFALFWYGVMPIFIVWKWWTGGRDPKPMTGQAVAWYSPPKTKKGRELTPAETGTLIDETVNIKDMYGSLIDLSRR